jgi:LysM repeat protein
MFLHKRLHTYLLWATFVFAFLAVLSALVTDGGEADPSATTTTTVPTTTTTTTIVLDSNRTHTVKPGESLYSIAEDYNLSAPALQELNEIGDNENLAVGQVLRLPPSTGFVPIGATTTMPP